MLMRLWNFTRGYVKIKLECYRPERIVNILLAEGVVLHNTERMNTHEMQAVISLKDYQLVCDSAQTYDYTVTVLSSHGLPVFFRVLASRPLLIFSVLLWLAAAIILSGRVFIFNITGCDRVSENEILTLMENMGIKKGSPKAGIDCKELSRAVLEYDSRISFADIRLHGVVLTAVIHEADTFKFSEKDDTPSSIYADKDCVIVKITVRHGTPAVKPGQAVRRGELLISGDITPEHGNSEKPVKIAAEGTVSAQTAYRFCVTVERSAEIFIRSGRVFPYTDIKFFSLDFPSEIPFADYETEILHTAMFTGCVLPLKIESGSAYELVNVISDLDDTRMKQLALKKADALILKTVPGDARIIMRSSEFSWNDDGSLELTVNIQAIENIGYSRYI